MIRPPLISTWFALRKTTAHPKRLEPLTAVLAQGGRARAAPSIGSLTAKKTANFTDAGEQTWTILEPEGARSNCGGPRRTPVDASPAVFKTVCGALLRRPGWVRFPSIPATLQGRARPRKRMANVGRRSSGIVTGSPISSARVSPSYRPHRRHGHGDCLATSLFLELALLNRESGGRPRQRSVVDTEDPACDAH